MFDKMKKKQQDSAEHDGMDILTEVKEPFSLSGFFETHIVERAKRIKSMLAEKGILFFLFSPFQARNRLIAQMVILCIGVGFGVIPRASSLVGELQDQAYASEMSGLSAKTVGSLKITPAASSNYKGIHMLAFVLEGKILPSDASKYEVHMARSYGASDWEDVTYSWNVYPVEDGKRILLVAVDQTKQRSGYGAFDLYIQLAGDEVPSYAKAPFEVTLSSAQDTTALYDKTGVHLSALTEAICGTGKIAERQEEFQEALKKYQSALEQAEAMPVDIQVSPTKDELENYCLANRLYRALDDHSTTEDILSIEATDKPELAYGIVITSEGIQYDSEFIKELTESSEDKILKEAYDSVDSAKTSVISAMDSVNEEARAWYSKLTDKKLILNQTVKVDSFPLSARCTNTIEDTINFLNGTVTDVPEEDGEQGGMTGTVTDDVTEPSDTSTEPSGDVTEPSDEITEPSDTSTEPSDTSTEPSGDATEPSGNIPIAGSGAAPETSAAGGGPASSGAASDPADNK